MSHQVKVVPHSGSGLGNDKFLQKVNSPLQDSLNSSLYICLNVSQDTFSFSPRWSLQEVSEGNHRVIVHDRATLVNKENEKKNPLRGNILSLSMSHHVHEPSTHNRVTS